MKLSNGYVLSPLVQALRRIPVAPLLLVTPFYAFAVEDTQIVDNRPESIGPTSGVFNWQVLNGGVLNANGAKTGFITAERSTLNFTGTVVDGTGVEEAMVINDASTVNLTGSTIGGAEKGLVLLLQEGNPANGNKVTVTSSNISGTDRGGFIAQHNVLDLVDSSLSATGTGGIGYEAFGGTVDATRSQISGVQNGVLVRRSGGGQAHSLRLDGSSVTGQTGAAIVVRNTGRDTAPTVISVLNGSTLTGGNGVMLDVDRSNVAMDVQNSDLAGNILVRNDGKASFSLDQARMTGDVIAEAGSEANVSLANQSILTGRLENVSSLAVNSAAQWVMVEDSSVANLSMDGGAIKLGAPDAFYTLSVENLSGSGTFVMDADFAQGKVDFLDVTGTASGNHSLLVGATGADPVADSSLHVVHTAAGDAQFSLLNGPVDMGTYSYELSQQNGNDWYLVNTGKVSAGTSAVLALFNTAPTVWYGELSTLRSRMGELRINGAQPGGWIRTYGNKFDAKAASGVGYQQTQQGISFGADAPLPVGDGQWLVGLLGGYSKSDLNLDRGTSGNVNSYYLGAYTTWLDQDSGYYFDGVLKFNRFRNEADVSLSDGTESKGDYDNSGVGASLEFGKHIKLDNDYFLEPYTQLSGVLIQGKDYDLDNGMQAEGDRTRSLLGKLGTTAGRNFDLGEGKVVQPYVRAAYVHEFAKNNDVEVNNNVFNNDLSGSRGELGAGIAMSMSDRLQVHADFEYSNGDKIEQPWGANVGLRYSW